jgi:hypothetical protein
LTLHGWSVFWDQRIPPGQTFEEFIEARIRDCRVMIVLWSPYAVDSRWVKREAAEGRDRSILIPVLIASAAIPFGFRDLQAADLTKWKPQSKSLEFDGLVSSIDELAPRIASAPDAGTVGATRSDVTTGPVQVRRSVHPPPLGGTSKPVGLRLAQAEPDRADYQRDLSVSYGRMGDLHGDVGQGEQARDAYQQALAIMERLAQIEPDRADFQRDLGLSLMRIGALSASTEQLSRALAILASLAASGRLNPEDRLMLEHLERALRHG